jgi:hypothetical protein
MTDRNVKNVFKIDGKCVVVVSGIKDFNDVVAINMSDTEYDTVNEVLDDDMTTMVELGLEMMNKATEKGILPKDVFNYMFNSILWNV